LLSLTKMAFMWFDSPRPPDLGFRRPSKSLAVKALLFAHHHLLLMIRVVFNPLWLPAFPGIVSKSLAVKALLQKDTRYIYMEFQKDEMVVEPVAVVVSNVLEPKIDNQILYDFMELDPVFILADVDADVEPLDSYFTVDSFASITNPHAYYNMDKVRIDFVWLDQNANKLYYFLHDKKGEKMVAEVPLNLIASYKEKDFA
ncbi:hypothetical protein Tco_1443565, partial [Tanacetum coccineum]